MQTLRWVGLAALLSLASCGGGGDPVQSGSTAAAATPTPTSTQAPTSTPRATATPTPTPTPVVYTAESPLLALRAAGLPVGDYVAYTAENDPNHLLGRPGQYTSKVNFHDTRLTASSSFDTRGGGSIEAFDNADDARRRKDYIDTIGKSAPIFLEYTFQRGRILLRLAKELTPAQAAEYEMALKALPGQ